MIDIVLPDCKIKRTWTLVGLGIRSIWSIRFGLFGFQKFRASKSIDRNNRQNYRNRTQINRRPKITDALAIYFSMFFCHTYLLMAICWIKKKKRKLSPRHHNSGRSGAWAKLQRWVDVLLKVEIVLGQVIKFYCGLIGLFGLCGSETEPEPDIRTSTGCEPNPKADTRIDRKFVLIGYGSVRSSGCGFKVPSPRLLICNFATLMLCLLLLIFLDTSVSKNALGPV